MPPKESSSKTKWVTKRTENLDKFYHLGKAIGQPGQFGQAYRITHKETGELRAAKVISKNKFRAEEDKKFHFQQLRGEIAVMQQMKHDNIIQLFEVYESSGHLYLVMTLCEGGELFDRIKDQPSGSYSEKSAAHILKQIIDGLAYMHQNKIAHCDLKPDNFLFLDSTEDSVLKIIDFGMSKHVEARKYMASFRGTPYYVAPEILAGKYAEHCDIWSFGVVMFVMLFGYPPFHANTDDEIFAKINKGFKAETKKGYGAWFPSAIPCSDDAKDLVAKCLNPDMASRISASEVLEHPFFTEARSTDPIDAMMKNLKDFTGRNKFKASVLKSMASAFETKGDEEQLRTYFKKVDANGDGTITKSELKQAFGDKLPQEELDAMFAAADFDGDGAISYEELLLTAVDRKIMLKEERMWKAFCKFDVDLNGTIDKGELMTILSVSETEADELIKEVDSNNDGLINYDEFKAMWNKKDSKGEGAIMDAPSA